MTLNTSNRDYKIKDDVLEKAKYRNNSPCRCG